MRLEDDNFKDKLMVKANNNASKFTVKLIVEHRRKVICLHLM